MISYWPYKQGIDLNNEVASLFFITKRKLTNNLSNQTSYNLYIDILDDQFKSKLFKIILMELEILILDIIELDLTIQNIEFLKHKILSDLLRKTLNSFLSYIDNDHYILSKFSTDTELVVLLSDYQLNLEYLLIYLIFGSSYISNYIFTFDQLNTPKEHIYILLENFVIQLANLVFFSVLKNIKSLAELTDFVQRNSLCNRSYISIRSLAFFRNSIIFQNLLYSYIQQPKEIYSSRYKVWLISSNGLVSKYIFMSRLKDLSKLSNLQLVFILLIELQDLIIPRLEKLLLVIGKFILYVFISLLGNSIIICVRVIVSKIYRRISS